MKPTPNAVKKGSRKNPGPPDYKEVVDTFARYIVSVTDLDYKAAERRSHDTIRAILDVLYEEDASASSSYRSWEH